MTASAGSRSRSASRHDAVAKRISGRTCESFPLSAMREMVPRSLKASKHCRSSLHLPLIAIAADHKQALLGRSFVDVTTISSHDHETKTKQVLGAMSALLTDPRVYLSASTRSTTEWRSLCQSYAARR